MTAEMRTAATVPVGEGDYRFDVIHDWLRLPSSIRMGDTHGLAQDRDGAIYVAHTVHPSSECQDAIAVFDEYGRFVRSFGAFLKGGAHGLEIREESGDEFLYHCDTARRRVVKTDLFGQVLWERGTPEEPGVYGPDAPYIPTNIAFGPAGTLFVTDGYGSDWIHELSADGEWLRTFGGRGSEPGKLCNAHGIALDTRSGEPLLAVADRGNRRIQYLDLEGRHVRFVVDGMRQPCHFDLRGELMLVPDLASVVTLLDADHRVVAQLGDGFPSALRERPRTEFRVGEFIHPHDAIFLRGGDILVAEWVPIGRVTLLRSTVR